MSQPSIVSVRLPMKIRKRGGRKLILTPQDSCANYAPLRPTADTTMVKALARGFRWRKMLETGCYANIEEIGAAEKISPTFVSKLLRLTLLSPDIIEMILDGRQPALVTMQVLLRPFPLPWNEQRGALGLLCPNGNSC